METVTRIVQTALDRLRRLTAPTDHLTLAVRHYSQVSPHSQNKDGILDCGNGSARSAVAFNEITLNVTSVSKGSSVMHVPPSQERHGIISPINRCLVVC